MRRALARAFSWAYDPWVSSPVARVEIGEMQIVHAGLPVPVQIVRLSARLDAVALELLLINPPESFRDNDKLFAIEAALAGSYPGVLLTFYKSFASGQATVVHAGPASAPAVAAAVSAWSFSGAWDESDPIVVTVNNRRHACSVSHANGHFDVTVRELGG